MKKARILTLLLMLVVNLFLVVINQSRQLALLRTTATLKSTTAALAQLGTKTTTLSSNYNVLVSQSTILRSNCDALVLKANNVGFAGSLFGYEACRQGMDARKFVDLSAQIFKGTNVVDINIDIQTNVEIQQIKTLANPKRRL